MHIYVYICIFTYVKRRERAPRIAFSPIKSLRDHDGPNGFCLQNGSNHGQNLAVTALYVPYSLHSGPPISDLYREIKMPTYE